MPPSPSPSSPPSLSSLFRFTLEEQELHQRTASLQRRHFERAFLKKAWIASARYPGTQFSVEHLQFSTFGGRLEIYDSLDFHQQRHNNQQQQQQQQQQQLYQPIASVAVSGEEREVRGATRRLKHIRWFPLDNLLLTGATLDGRLVVYDGLMLVPVETFTLPKGIVINDQSLPRVAHSKILAAGTSHGMRLFDLRSGSNIHNLMHTHSILRLAWDPHRSQDIYAGGEGGLFYHWDLRRLDTPIFRIQARSEGGSGGMDIVNLHALGPSFGHLGTVFLGRRDGEWAVYSHYWRKFVQRNKRDPGNSCLSGQTALISNYDGIIPPLLIGGVSDRLGHLGILDCNQPGDTSILQTPSTVPGILSIDKVIIGNNERAYILDKTASMINMISLDWNHHHHEDIMNLQSS